MHECDVSTQNGSVSEVMNTNDTNWDRFFALRKRVFAAIRKTVEDPEDVGYHKRYDGAMDVTFCYSNYFISENERAMNGVKIELRYYQLINGSHKEWWGNTFEEALDKAEAGIDCFLDE